MRIYEIKPQEAKVVLELDRNEIRAINNSLLDVLYEYDDNDFDSIIGISKDDGRLLLDQIQLLIKELI